MCYLNRLTVYVPHVPTVQVGLGRFAVGSATCGKMSSPSSNAPRNRWPAVVAGAAVRGAELRIAGGPTVHRNVPGIGPAAQASASSSTPASTSHTPGRTTCCSASPFSPVTGSHEKPYTAHSREGMTVASGDDSILINLNGSPAPVVRIHTATVAFIPSAGATGNPTRERSVSARRCICCAYNGR